MSRKIISRCQLEQFKSRKRRLSYLYHKFRHLATTNTYGKPLANREEKCTIFINFGINLLACFCRITEGFIRSTDIFKKSCRNRNRSLLYQNWRKSQEIHIHKTHTQIHTTNQSKLYS